MDILFLLTIKHAFVDLYLQSFHSLNKREYFGGWLHYLEHGGATLVIACVFFSFDVAFILASIDFILHWHIDYAKHVIQNRWNITTTNRRHSYWFIQCVDQSLHFTTYFVLCLIGVMLS